MRRVRRAAFLFSRYVRRPVARRVWKVTIRGLREILLPIRIRILQKANLHDRASILGEAPVLVSLTTHGARVSQVHLAIESIAHGKLRPTRLILWVDSEVLLDQLPPAVRRLERRGLEVKIAENLGPHTKYFPALKLLAGSTLKLVTADDDIVYPRAWLRDLVKASIAYPQSVNCHQSHRMTFYDGEVAPYSEWKENWSVHASPTTFPLGVSGVLYPPKMITALLDRGKLFLGCTPRADDVWLHFVATEEGIPIRQVSSIPTHFSEIPTPAASRLSDENIANGGNDAQIRATYSAEAWTRLRSEPQH